MAKPQGRFDIGCNLGGRDLRDRWLVDHLPMSTRGAEFLYHWISDHMPEKPLDDLLLSVTDLADEAKREADRRGITNQEIEEEIDSVYEAIFHAVEHREGGLPDERLATLTSAGRTTTLRMVVIPTHADFTQGSTRCGLSGGCPFGPNRGDWSYHASALTGGSE
jgi:hypothetical protein